MKLAINPYYSQVRQIKLKTIQDLQHHLKIHGPAQHVVHDCETDWWWFADDRNRLLEEVFNSGSRVVFAPKTDAARPSDDLWEVQSDLVPHVEDFRLESPFISAKMNTDTLTDLFWTEFLNQEHERFAYWDLENPDNGFEAYLFYRELMETGGAGEKSAD